MLAPLRTITARSRKCPWSASTGAPSRRMAATEPSRCACVASAVHPSPDAAISAAINPDKHRIRSSHLFPRPADYCLLAAPAELLLDLLGDAGEGRRRGAAELREPAVALHDMPRLLLLVTFECR